MKRDEFVKLLHEAYKNTTSISRDILPTDVAGLEDAYAVQHAFTALKEANGDTLGGYKISLTSDATQKLFGVTEPLYGQIMADHVVAGPLVLSGMNLPKIELELVFIAQEDLLPTDTQEQLLAKVHVAPGLEVPDSRYEDWFPKLSKEQLCCDGAVGGYLAYGEAIPTSYAALDGVNGALIHNGAELSSNTSNAVLGHPANALSWLVEKLHGHGLLIKKGMFVSAGTFTPPMALEKGTYLGRYENIGTISIEVV